MSRPYAGMGIAAAGSAAAFWATDLYASNLASLPGEAVTNLSAALSTLPSYIAVHGPLPTTAPLALACGLAAGCGVWVAWANMVARRGNYRAGEEHGSARWATPRELRRLADEAHPDDNILLTQGVRLAMSRDDHDPRWERNRNVVVIGGSGSGKTRTYVEPNLMQMNASYLVTDPKGTTVRRLGGMLAAHGYEVRTLNTVDFSLSMRYNPLAYVRTQQDVLELVECLIVNTTPKGKARPHDAAVARGGPRRGRVVHEPARRALPRARDRVPLRRRARRRRRRWPLHGRGEGVRALGPLV